VDINIFVMKYYFFLFLHILHFLKSLKSKSTQMLRPQKGHWGVSFNDTLLNFGLRCTSHIYAIKPFWALEYHFIENLKLLLKENQIMK